MLSNCWSWLLNVFLPWFLTGISYIFRRMKLPIVREDYLVDCFKKQKKLPFDLYKVEVVGEASSMVTVKVKGRSAVHESSGLQDTCHILEDGKSIYNTTLSMSDLSTGVNRCIWFILSFLLINFSGIDFFFFHINWHYSFLELKLLVFASDPHALPIMFWDKLLEHILGGSSPLNLQFTSELKFGWKHYCTYQFFSSLKG